MSFTSLSLKDQQNARAHFEELVRNQVTYVVEEYEILTKKELPEEEKTRILEEEVKQVTENSMKDVTLEELGWENVEDWDESWIRELISEHGTVYDLYYVE
jgi:uncharacterized membrane-anchored protein